MSHSKKIAFLFPGQGVQYLGMGKDIYENFSIARQTFQEADKVLHRHLSKIILEGPEEELLETKNSQVGIYVVSMALLRIIKDLYPNIQPDVCAGLSLGEYSALAAAKKLDFASCLSIIQYRGHYMNEACEAHPGGMAVVLGLTAREVEEAVQEVNLPHDLWIANFNCPGQIVISGTRKGIDSATSALKDKGAKRVLPLNVYGAFHSGLMKTAEARLAEHIHHASIQDSSIGLIMNVPGKKVENILDIKNHLIRQVTSPVRWEQSIRHLGEEGIELFIEIGCGKTLAGFNKRILPHINTISVEKITELDQLAKI
ncbi:ACP S-malonyltransferase [Neochlamydia sp. AcF95]|uniref:ACP S-malonyltransferase n=1 Tax=Neochlamydia sp. AcF95 TaxID=2795734 RepID=UPI001BC981E0|nr:ACP S-malonyltransferase [Neochlamydia sp. AcF95]MBS4170823.1 Malonyl CoA-acyl carrier protein transacylase [Neochlamydia sp. AcF95]